MDPIGLAGGLNLYGYASGDPVGNSDPFGLYVYLYGSRAWQDSVRAAINANPALKRDYEAAHADTTAVFVIAQDPRSDLGRTYGGRLENGEDNVEFLVSRLRDFSGIRNPYPAPIRGMITVGASPDHTRYDCTLRHEFVHLRGLVNGGTTQISVSANLQFEFINIKMGCNGQTHRK